MATYSEYKDSGQAWLGAIPSHWSVDSMKHLFSVRSIKGHPELPQLCSTQRYGVIPQSLYDNRVVSVLKGLDTLKVVNVGDFVISLRSFQGGIEYAHYDGIISPAYTILKPVSVSNSPYYRYLLKSQAFIFLLQSMVTGIREGQNIDYSSLRYESIPIPPLVEQEAIVEYLDKATADIDKTIEAKERIIAVLEERRKIIITEAVTRGITPNVPLRDSGIDWLGQIPAHWETIPVRHVFEFRNGYTPSKVNPAFWTNGTIPWFRMEDIRKSGRKLDKAIQYVTPAALNNGGTFEAGSFIMAICTASIGEHAMLIADSLANQQFANLKIRKSLSARFDSQFVFYYLYVLGKYCRDSANITTFQYADMTLVKNFLVPIPSLDEQNKIVEYLDFNTKGIDSAIHQQKHLIELLRERKNIIINEAVTGKVKVI